MGDGMISEVPERPVSVYALPRPWRVASTIWANHEEGKFAGDWRRGRRSRLAGEDNVQAFPESACRAAGFGAHGFPVQPGTPIPRDVATESGLCYGVFKREIPC